jgi:integrase
MGIKVYGPERHGLAWRLDIRRDGVRARPCFATEAEALAEKEAILRGAEAAEGIYLTVGKALERYGEAMEKKGNKPGSVTTTLIRLRSFFDARPGAQGAVAPMRGLSAAHCRSLYEARAATRAVATQRNELAEARTFLRWARKAKLIAGDPLRDVEPQGRRKKGKEQLRIDEARRWTAKAVELAEAGDAGAVAALMSLLMGLRASEITTRTVRDLDDDGRLLWVPEAKTEAGKRTVEVPAVLRPLLQRVAWGKPAGETLFGTHWRDWPRENVQRICRLAGVPPVSAHAMRGLHATLARESGITAHAVAASLGHESPRVTEEHYTTAEATAKATQRAALRVLSGGKPHH